MFSPLICNGCLIPARFLSVLVAWITLAVENFGPTVVFVAAAFMGYAECWDAMRLSNPGVAWDFSADAMQFSEMITALRFQSELRQGGLVE